MGYGRGDDRGGGGVAVAGGVGVGGPVAVAGGGDDVPRRCAASGAE